MKTFPIAFAASRPPTAKLKPLETRPNTGDWKSRHNEACAKDPLALLITGLDMQQRRYFSGHGVKIAEDFIIGAEFLNAWKAVRAMLNGVHGLDNGTADGALVGILTEAGFDVEAL